MKNQTLGRQFRIWTVLLVVVPSLLVMAIYTIGQISVVKGENLEIMSQRVDSQERLINYWILERVSDVRKLTQLESVRSLDEQQMKATFYVMQQDSENFDSLSYIDKDGFFKLSTLNRDIQYPSAIGQSYFEAALAGKEYVSDVVIGRNSGLPIINFSCPLFDKAGNFQGLILGSVKTTTLEVLLRNNWIGETGEVLLVNRDGTMLTEPRYLRTLIDKGLTADTAIMKLKLSDDALRNIKLGQSGTATWVNYMDDKVLGAYKYMPERGWTLIGKNSEKEIFSPIYNQLAMMAIGTFLLVMLMLPLATLITNRIKRSIDWLIEQSSLVATRDYEMIGQDKRPGNIPHELGTLCDTFVKMSHKIAHTIGQLRENEAQLESKVIEIQDINAILEEEISERQTVEEEIRQLNMELEHKVCERTMALSKMNAALEKEINEHQMANKALIDSRDALVDHEEQLKDYADELAITNRNLIILNEDLKRISLSDGLTGIANRRYFDEFLEREWQRATREKTSLALLMVDIDFFKAYNDTYGHIAGDDCLKLMTSMLETMPKRAIDLVARYGGEELALVLPDTEEQGAEIMAEKVRAGVEKLGIEHKQSSISKHVTVSVGVAVIVPEREALPSAIIAAADQALYLAKGEGRNRIKMAKKA